MKYKEGQEFPYIANSDWYVTPTGEVGFRKKDIPEEIKERLREDIRKRKEEEMTLRGQWSSR